jgi:DNA-binding NtrC family response regulator
VEIEVPPLRERRDDIMLLAVRFLEIYSRKYGRTARGFSRSATEALLRYPWPGNVRELSHVIERAVLIGGGEHLEAGDFMLERRAPADSQALDQLTLEGAEELLIRQALARCGGNVQAAAEQLGVSRSALYRRMEKYGT